MKTSEVLGLSVLVIGIILLITTFVDAYLFLTEDISILPVPDLLAVFGEALAPLIEASIRMIYLGVMGWIGSTITMRGMTVLLQTQQEAKPEKPKKAAGKAEPKDLDEVWEKALQEAKLEVKSI